jgi:hypothetical protein
VISLSLHLETRGFWNRLIFLGVLFPTILQYYVTVTVINTSIHPHHFEVWRGLGQCAQFHEEGEVQVLESLRPLAPRLLGVKALAELLQVGSPGRLPQGVGRWGDREMTLDSSIYSNYTQIMQYFFIRHQRFRERYQRIF